MEILTYGNKILKQNSEPVQTMTPKLQELITRMAGTMYKSKGVGLAAPQVGQLIRAVVLDVDQIRTEENPKPQQRLQVFINPEILEDSKEDSPYTEGCLSIPGVEGKVFRPKTVRLRFRNEDFKEREIAAEGLLARVIQHELDHLNGILFVDRLSFTQRALIAGKLSRLRKQNQSGKKSGKSGETHGLII